MVPPHLPSSSKAAPIIDPAIAPPTVTLHVTFNLSCCPRESSPALMVEAIHVVMATDDIVHAALSEDVTIFFGTDDMLVPSPACL
ncbi:hypothetical protein AMTR_s00073p00127660 [Amborella trichopoda]|uniref:Uncharacterized protein n=1 Tax=Amborella trichopoda TaxID=13333 RepID=W1NNH9_AMBTC|nr:hypothetical protein AMTR_s00073p00127660 [Amborella trichopoda]